MIFTVNVILDGVLVYREAGWFDCYVVGWLYGCMSGLCDSSVVECLTGRMV
jgi:hypothetical protein